MNIKKIRSLISQGESSVLEFKTSTANLKSVFQTACAFLNGKGGNILIGVKDKGQIIGQNVTDSTRREIAREVNKLEPSAQGQIDIHFIPFEADKYVIQLEVQAGRHAPYLYDGRAYTRVQSSTASMTQHLYEQLLVRRGQLNHTWETDFAEGYEIDDLDQEEIRRTIKEGVDQNRISVEVLNYDIQQILSNLKLHRHGQLINAAIVLYAKQVEPNYSQCMIRMARFRGRDKLGDFIDNQRVYGNAFRLISLALEFTQRHLPIASFFEPDKIERIDQPAVPALALREALINAISHRNYANHTTSIALAIYDDRLEIWNHGELPPPLTLEDLKKPHQSYPRNEEIATLFYKRGWVEGWGTGTLRMIGYCRKNQTPDPEFHEYSGGFAVTFKFKEPMDSADQRTASGILAHELTTRQKAIIDILSSGAKMTIRDIASRLKEPPPTRTLRHDLGRLKDMGLVNLEGRAKTARWFFIGKQD